jgi:LDH2 family malate/lactate/ureidoglycolate dehydrogenase
VAYLPLLDKKAGEGTGHFFGAMRIDAFQTAGEFKSKMDEWITTFRSAKPAEGQDRVLIPGDPEREAETRIMKDGISLVPAVKKDLEQIAKELDISFN